MSLQFNLVDREGSRNLVVFLNGVMYTADENHPNMSALVDKVVRGDADGLADLFDASVEAAKRFERLSETVSVANSRVFVDGDEVDDVYADQIVRFMQEDADFGPLVKFLEKVYTNTEAHTRENLSRWLEATGGFTIDDDGDIRGYKGVNAELGSIHHGPAVVDGVSVTGSVPNKVGSVVEMARSKVQHDPSVGCAVGLHVGTWAYASSFARGNILEVKVNPRDVVSVPTDCNGQKMRVSRYKVVSVLDAPHTTAFVSDNDEEDYDYDEYYEDDYDF